MIYLKTYMIGFVFWFVKTGSWDKQKMYSL